MLLLLPYEFCQYRTANDTCRLGADRSTMDLAVLRLLFHRRRRDSFQCSSHDDPYRCFSRDLPVGLSLCIIFQQALTRIFYSSKAFFYAQGVTIVGEMLAPPLGAYLMRSSLWVPIIIGFACLLLAVALTVVIPETRFTALATGEPQEDGPACNPAGPSESEERKVDFGLKGRFEAAVRHSVSTVGFVLKHRNLVLLMAVFFSTDFAQQSPTILLRYVSSRYSVSLAKVCTHISKFIFLCVHE